MQGQGQQGRDRAVQGQGARLGLLGIRADGLCGAGVRGEGRWAREKGCV